MSTFIFREVTTTCRTRILTVMERGSPSLWFPKYTHTTWTLMYTACEAYRESSHYPRLLTPHTMPCMHYKGTLERLLLPMNWLLAHQSPVSDILLHLYCFMKCQHFTSLSVHSIVKADLKLIAATNRHRPSLRLDNQVNRTPFGHLVIRHRSDCGKRQM